MSTQDNNKKKNNNNNNYYSYDTNRILDPIGMQFINNELPPFIKNVGIRTDCMTIYFTEMICWLDKNTENFKNFNNEWKHWISRCAHCNRHNTFNGSLALSIYISTPVDKEDVINGMGCSKVKSINLGSDPDPAKNIEISSFVVLRIICTTCVPKIASFSSAAPTKNSRLPLYEITTLQANIEDIIHNVINELWNLFITKKRIEKYPFSIQQRSSEDWKCDICLKKTDVVHDNNAVITPCFTYDSKFNNHTVQIGVDVTCSPEHMQKLWFRKSSYDRLYSTNPLSDLIRGYLLIIYSNLSLQFPRWLNMLKCGREECTECPLKTLCTLKSSSSSTKQETIFTCENCSIIYCSEKCRLESSSNHADNRNIVMSTIKRNNMHNGKPTIKNGASSQLLSECEMYKYTSIYTEPIFPKIARNYALWGIPIGITGFKSAEKLFRDLSYFSFFHKIDVSDDDIYLKKVFPEKKKLPPSPEIILLHYSLTAHKKKRLQKIRRRNHPYSKKM